MNVDLSASRPNPGIFVPTRPAPTHPLMANLCWTPRPPKEDLIEETKKAIELNLVQGFPLAKASSVAYGTRSKGHGKNDNLACGKRVIKCRNSRSHLPTRSRVSAYPDPSRFMLVLFANLKAGFSPSEPDGAGVVSIWIPASHHSVPFHSEFSITENEPLPKNYLLETKQTKVKERWISEEGMLTFDNNLNRLLSNGFRWGRIVRWWVIRWGLILVRWGLVAVRRPRSRVGVW